MGAMMTESAERQSIDGLVLPHRAPAVLCVGALAVALGVAAAAMAAMVHFEWPSVDEAWLTVLGGAGIGSLAGAIALATMSWTMASGDLARMARGAMDPAGRGQTTLGWLMAMAVAALVVAAGLAKLGTVLWDLGLSA